LSQFTHVTDGRTDRWTDRIFIAIPLLHFMQRGKNGENHWPQRLQSVCAAIFSIQ